MEFERLRDEKKRVKHRLDSTRSLHEPLKQRCSDVQKQAQQLSQQISQQVKSRMVLISQRILRC